MISAMWSVIGYTAALTLGIHEDVGILVAGLAGRTLVLMAKQQLDVSNAS